MPAFKIYGPYPHRERYRCFIKGSGGGTRFWCKSGRTPAEALRFAESAAEGYRAKVELTLGGLVESYLEFMTIDGKQPQTVENARNYFRALLEGAEHTEVALLSVQRAKRIYMDLVPRRAAATHQRALRYARTCWSWAVRERLAAANPWREVRQVGKENKGKEQLTRDEERRLAEAALPDAMTSDMALAVLLLTYCNLRSSEVRKRNVRDVDEGGAALVVPCTKTPNGKRTVDIPGIIQTAIRARCNRPALEPLLLDTKGRRPLHQWVYRAVRKYCKRAGVQAICPHALRGGWATIAYGIGVRSEDVAAALGHASPRVTEAHYAKPEAVERAKQARKIEVLLGPGAMSPACPQPDPPPNHRRN